MRHSAGDWLAFGLALATAAAVWLIVTAGAPAAPPVDAADVIAFHRHYNAWERKFFGCSPDTTSMRDCRPKESGLFDAHEYRSARDAAARVFHLTEK